MEDQGQDLMREGQGQDRDPTGEDLDQDQALKIWTDMSKGLEEVILDISSEEEEDLLKAFKTWILQKEILKSVHLTKFPKK